MIDLEKLYAQSVWEVESVTERPSEVLRSWSCYEVQKAQVPKGERTRHIVGYCSRALEGRVSSAIVSVDPKNRSVRTESGRIYELVGVPGWNDDAHYTWGVWKRRCGAEDQVDVTDELLAKFDASDEPSDDGSPSSAGGEGQ